MEKNDIDKRVIEWITYLVNTKRYKSEREYLIRLGLPPNKVTDARKGKASFRADDIGKILIDSAELNGHWILTGQGDMFISNETVSSSELISFLKKQNSELIDTVSSLNREIGELKNIISSLKKENVRLDMVADNADAEQYSLAK